jgi:uncharacterized DUF497 family protein
MKRYTWDPLKNDQLQERHGVGFTDITTAIEAGHLLRDIPYHNQEEYGHQRLLIVRLNDYAYVVPCIVSGESYHFITLFPSRKATRDYLP